MIKALLKKQMLEVFSWLYKNRKSGKHRTVKGVVGYALFYLMVFGWLGVVFGFVANEICEPLRKADMGWLYWCLMGMIAIFLGVFGSVFNTYSSLYQAKDNDLLLSMPIPVSHVLLARLSGVYAMGLLYEMIVMIPAGVIWLKNVPFTFLGTVNVIFVPIVLSFFILVFSTVLGWVVALVLTKVKRKNIVTVILSLVFITVYYYLYGNAYAMMQTILLNPEEFGEKFRNLLYLLYHMGRAAEGNLLSMFVFTAIIGLLTVIVYFVLSKNFFKLATSNRGIAKSVYKERDTKAFSVKSALLHKELRRFTGSANYMLNCGLGIILMPVSAVLLWWKADTVRLFVPLVPDELLALAAIGAVCLMTSMNDITAPSVSLEGKNIWILQSFPVSGRDILKAKLKLQLLLTLIPAIAPVVVVEWLLLPKLFWMIEIPVITALYVFLMALIGLFCNLKMPNLHWSNEVIPIKQSMPTMIGLFGGWMIILAMAGIYFFASKYIGAVTFAVCVTIILIVVNVALFWWVMGKGAKIFEKL